ncbi:MAG: hypothetical protein WCC48_06925, partial [Anaeromyxobacteraceae bacterium]
LALPVVHRGDEPPPAAAPPNLTVEPPPDLTVPPPPPLQELLLAQPPARDVALEASAERRRALLTAHQAAGIAAWALMGATVVVGQLDYNDLYGGGGGTQRYQSSHRTLVAASTATFAFTGILALAAPGPGPGQRRAGTSTVHKSAMAITTLGILSEIVLGLWTARAPGNVDQPRLARAHQALGYATFGAMTVGAVTLVF